MGDDVKCLGIILDSHLRFDKQVIYICKKVRSNFNCFRIIRKYLSLNTAQLFMHTTIFSHPSCCITSWLQASQTTLKLITPLFNQTISFESFITSCNLKLIFYCLYGLALLLFNEFTTRQQDARRVNKRD